MVSVVLVLHPSGKIKHSIRFTAPGNTTPVGGSGATLLISSINHERIVSHRSFDVLAFRCCIVEPLAPHRRVLGKELSITKPSDITQYWLTSVMPYDIYVIRMLMRARMERRAKSKIAALKQITGSLWLW